ncbi:MAG: DUF4249 domain-containing protein [Saprospiraceae bacterium]
MKNILYTVAIIITILWTAACNLEKTVDLNLPEFESQLVVECYLEVGKPYRVLLTESVSYFGTALAANLPAVSGATVIITYNGVSDTLTEAPFLDLDNQKIFNYGSSTIVPENYDNEFSLEVIDTSGRSLIATTKLLQSIPLDSIQTIQLEDTSVTILTIHTDIPNEDNFYYRTLHRTKPISDSMKIAFVIDDAFINSPATNQLVIGSPPFFKAGDTAVVTLYHVTKGFADYLETTSSSEQNNGNPFGTPGTIKSNVEGGFGVFTGLSYVRDTFYLD